MPQWIEACCADAIEPEGVIWFDHADRTYALYRSTEGEFFATNGLCTHEKVHLAEGIVTDDIIECPKHNGCLDKRRLLRRVNGQSRAEHQALYWIHQMHLRLVPMAGNSMPVDGA